MQLFLLAIYYGIFAGLFYLVINFINKVALRHIIFKIILDFVFVIASGALLFYINYQYNDGEIRLFFIIGYLVGIITTIISLKNLVDLIGNFLYNIIVKIVIFFNKPLKKKVKSEAKTIKQPN